MAASPARPAGRRFLQQPRRTLRLRLTLLYGSLFLLSGSALLAIDYVLAKFRFPLQIQGPPGAGGQGLSGTIQRVMASAGTQAAQQRTDALHALLAQYGIVLAVMTVLSIGLGWLVAGRVLRPLRTITTAARRISASNLHERLAMTGPPDELKELGDTFDALLGRLEGAFGAQRQFVANASHELRTPLARQHTLIEVALADPEPNIASLTAACERALAASEQQERLIDALLTLAQSQRGLDRRAPLDLAVIASDVLESRQLDAQRVRIEVSATLGPALVMGDARLTERLAANLVSNSLRHNVPGGWMEVITGTRAGHAVLSVANSGPVIPPSEVNRLFEPFQRLGAERTGSRDSPGLGLSIVKAIVNAHDARIDARALPGGGLEIQIHFLRVPHGLTESIVPGVSRPAALSPRTSTAGTS
jgi:signal transduction histidine kinase